MIRLSFISVLPLLFLFLSTGLNGQGWEYLYPNSISNASFSGLNVGPDGSYYTVANLRDGVDKWLQVIKTDSEGILIWNREIHPPSTGDGYRYYDLTQDAENNLLVTGRIEPADGSFQGFLLKLDEDGNTIWAREYPQIFISKGVTSLINGDYLLSGLSGDYTPIVLQTDADGTVLWEQQYDYYPGNPAYEFAHKTLALPNGNSLVLLGQEGVIMLWEFDASGIRVSEQTLSNPNGYVLSPCNLALSPQGELLVAARQIRVISGNTNIPFYSTMLWKLNADRELIWQDSTSSTTSFQNISNLSVGDQGEIFVARWDHVEKRAPSGEILCVINENGTRPWGDTYVEALPEGEAVIAATYYPGPPGESVLSLIKMDAGCVAAREYLSGTAFTNLGDNCDDFLAGNTLNNWLLELTTGAVSYYDFTDSTGQYDFSVSRGAYELTLHPPVNYWESCTIDSPITLNTGDSLVQDVNARIAEACPYPILDLALTSLRPCEERPAAISYGNFGTSTLDDAYLDLYLNPELSISSASQAYSNLGEDTYRFDLGDLPSGATGNIQLQLLTICEPDLTGTVACIEAEIFPATDCGDGAWDGPIITVNGTCLGDSIQFEVANIGLGNMAGPQELIVIEDDVMYLQTDFELDNGQSTIFTVPNQQAVYAARAEQAPGYPYGEYAYDWVAYCDNPDITTPPSNFFGQFPYLGNLPYADTECVPYVNSYDPNQKTAEPGGFGDAHFIEPSSQLEYQIDFQNTGSDTAYTVVLRDTLSPLLDIRRFQSGPASHNYDLELEEGNILVFTFNDINLVDSATNSAGSQGFVTYNISPVVDISNGSLIENRAAIYFDFNLPIITNTVWHTVQEDFLLVNVDEPWREALQIRVSPNPVASSALLQINGVEIPSGNMRLYNAIGQHLFDLAIENGRAKLPNVLASGYYLFQAWEKGTLVGTGKIIIQ